MKISITGMSVTIQQIDHIDIKQLCQKYLLLDGYEAEESSEDNRLTLKYCVPGRTKTCVIIETEKNILHKESNVTLLLSKRFFQTAPFHFNLYKLLRFFARYTHTINQIDITYLDEGKHLSATELVHLCKFSVDYCTGSLVTHRTPRFVLKNGEVRRILLESKESKTNYGVIHMSPGGGIKLVLSIKKKEKIQYVLGNKAVNVRYPYLFEARSKELLRSCIDFNTARTKKNRVKAKYQQQPFWAKFMGGEVDLINWSKICSEQKGKL